MNYIENFVTKWRSTFSSVVLVESDDPKRTLQIFDFLTSGQFHQWQNHEILHYDMWEGLRRKTGTDVNGKPTWELHKADSNNVFNQTDKIGLVEALDLIDNEIKTKKTVVVITGIISQDDSLTLAVNNWAVHPQILNQHSAVIIISSSRSILPQDTLLRVIFSKPPPSTEEERKIIINKIHTLLTEKPEVDQDTNGEIETEFELTENDVNGLVKALAGLNLHLIESTLCKSYYRYRDFNQSAIASMKREQVNKLGILQIEIPKYGMESIGGYKAVKQHINQRIIKVMENQELAKKLCMEPSRGVLLFGMGGTGKTIFARATAKAAQLPFFKLQTSDIYSKYVGESEKNIRNAIEIIEENAPCIVFIDEIDQLGKRSSTEQGDSGTSRRVFSHILEYLGNEERKSIFIGATNDIDALDRYFLREGRFEVIIPMLLPDYYARIEIFNIHFNLKRTMDVRLNSHTMEEFAEETEGSTGAEIEGMVIRSQATAFKDNRPYVTGEDTRNAIRSYNINSKKRKEEQERFIKTAHEICRDWQFIEAIEKEHLVKSRTDILKERIA